MLVIAAVIATSCEKEADISAIEKKATVSFNVETPQISTRAYSDGTTATVLQYAVYDEAGEELTALTKTDATIKGSTTVKLQLTTGNTYSVIFWAAAPNAPYTVDFSNKSMTVDYTAAVSNDESRDAFYAYETFVVKGSQTETIELKRPLAQLNIGTSDYEAAKAAGYVPAKSSVKVYDIYKTLDLTSGDVSDMTDVTFAENTIPAGETFPVAGHEYLAMNYVLVNEKEAIDIEFTYTDGSDAKTRTVGSVPVQRNYRTNIYGQLLTSDVDVNIEIKPGYNEPAHEADALYLAAAIGGEVTLAEDITLTEPLNIQSNMVLNMDGKTLTGAINVAEGVSLTVNNGSIENTDANTSGIVSNGNLTLNDVEITSARHALRIESGKVIINGGIYKVNPTSSKTLYALNVGDDNTEAEVIIKGGTFIGPKGTIADSGAAVAVKAGSKVTIEDGDFSGGKLNTLSSKGEMIITGGTFDQDPKAWVAEGYFSNKLAENKYLVSKLAYVSDAASLAALLTSDKEEISVVLIEDIDVAITSLGSQTSGRGEYKLGGADTKEITIDLNNKKLNITTTYWSAIGANNDNALFTIKNGTMTSTGNSAGTWNAWDLRFSNCNYVFEEVSFEKAVALDNVGKSTTMKGVTITDTHNTDTYGLWITAEGQSVTLEDCVIDMTPAEDGRGIKIDNQYVAAADEKKVTLNATNVTFKTEEKAAILVKSTAGAEINLSDVNIEAVAEDQQFAVWVDEDAAAHADKVVVNGGLKRVEGTPLASAGSQSEFTNAIADGATIMLSAGNYNMPSTGGNNITIIGDKDVVINAGASNMGNGNVTLEGVTITAGSYKGFQHSGVVTYNKVTINGQLNCYGDKDIFNDCTFNLNNSYVWTYGSKNTEFNNCVFNTTGKAILIYNEGAGACNVKVSGCTFNASTGAKAGAINNQNCAAIEIDNYAKMAHVLTTSNNTYSDNFSGEWRIKSYVAGAPVTVNGVQYTSIAVMARQ